MNRESVTNWQELSELYEQCDELDDAALDARLAQLQADSNPLLPQLERMLHARKQLAKSDFLDVPPRLSGIPRADESVWREGQSVGPYRLLRPLGSGGMAEVWLAARDDGNFVREVAIKLLYHQSHGHQRDSVAQRFQRERDILASLTHPHIASLLDAGVTPSGQPWLALEYVHGEVVTVWCDQQQLDLKARVRLFLQVLVAVEYAHGRLVIHRDLKPANILVTSQGQVQLLDFGIAKLLEPDSTNTDPSDLTRLGGQPLTPRYASPEQLRGLPLSTVSDVYSLGVVLYELLCGESAYELKLESNAQLESAILDNEVRAPSRRSLSPQAATARHVSTSALHKLLANDLDAIVLKALGKQASARYASVEALRLDLQRWLDGKPVLAKTPSKIYQLHKFVQRHRLAVGLGAAAITALLATAATAVFLGLQAREESARAVAARDFLIDMFRQADPDLSHGPEMTAKQLLDQGQKTIVSTLNAQPLLQAELLRGVADAHINMSDYLKADQTLTEVVQRYTQLGRTRDAALALASQAEASQAMGDNDRADALLAQAAARYMGHQRDAEFMAQYASVRGSLAFSRGDLQKARALLTSALAYASEAFGENDMRTVNAIRWLAEIEAQTGSAPSAIERLDKLLARVQHIKGIQAADMVGIQKNRANLEKAAGLFRLAAEHFEVAGRQCDHVINPYSILCTGLRNQEVVVLLLQGYREKALQLTPSLVAQTGADESPSRQAEALLAVCRVLALNGKRDEYPELWARMLALGNSGPEVRLPEFIKLYAMLLPADTLLQSGQAAAAQVQLKRIETRFAAGDQADRQFLGWLRLSQGLAAQALGQPEQALAYIQDATAEYAKLLGDKHPLVLLFSVHQARALWATQHREQALELLNQALPLLQDALGAQAPTFIQLQALHLEITRSPTMDPRTARKVDFFL
jgi:serine/threonine-protein kinase